MQWSFILLLVIVYLSQLIIPCAVVIYLVITNSLFITVDNTLCSGHLSLVITNSWSFITVIPCAVVNYIVITNSLFITVDNTLYSGQLLVIVYLSQLIFMHWSVIVYLSQLIIPCAVVIYLVISNSLFITVDNTLCSGHLSCYY